MNENEGVRPYVGVSGVVSPNIQNKLEIEAQSAGLFDEGRKLALGVKAVHKTQFLDIENKYGREWYPVGAENFTNALRHDTDSDQTIAVAQAYLDVEHVDDADYRRTFMARIAERGQPWLQAVQFDMLPWHDNTDTLDFIEELKQHYDLDVFLQVHKHAMEELGPRGVARRLGHYASSVSYLLFDSSHGTGTRLDVDRLSTFVDAAYQDMDTSKTGIAVAGGLNAAIVREDLPQLVASYPDLSWDAEGQLHPVNDAGKKPLDMAVVTEYLAASADVIRHSSAR